MNQRLGVAAPRRRCPSCNSSRFKEVLIEYKELGLGKMKCSVWMCGRCHFEWRKMELVQ